MSPDFSLLEPSLTHLQSGDRADIRRAFEFAQHAHAAQTREDGSPYVLHVIAVAKIVARWGADRDTISAALLHDVLEDTQISKEELVASFGRHVGLLVESITKFTQADLSPDLPLDRKVETLRKLFDVMRLDMRGTIIKLADRLHNVRTIDTLPTEVRRKRFADETLSVYYKIACHLGMREVRFDFAEYCVPSSFPDGLQTRIERDRFCDEGQKLRSDIEHDLRTAHDAHGIRSVTLQKRNLLVFHERKVESGGTALLRDAFSVSLLVQTEDDCYRFLKILHTLYRPVSGQFRDFLAAPSDAGYQSLHTQVILPGGTAIECRIRTPQMLEQAEKGITISLFSDEKRAPTFSWLKRSAQLDLKTRDSSSAFFEALESDVLRETISVMVDGTRLSLPRGSTALDASYAFYDARAGTTLSISMHGRPVSFGETLEEDSDLKVTLDASTHANVDWLQMVSMLHARLLIVDVLKRSNKSQKISLGAVLLQKELDHFNKGVLQDLSKVQCQHTAVHFRREHFDDVLAMIGEGVVRARDIVFYLFPDHSRSLLSVVPGRYHFRLLVAGTQQRQGDLLARLHGIIRLSDVMVDRTTVRFNADTHHFDLLLVGSCADRLQFADFVDLLDRQEWTSKVQPLISRWQKFLLVGSFAIAFAVIFLDILLFPAYEQVLERLPVLPQFLIQSIPLIPILAASYYVLRLLQHYIVRMRSERWFLGTGLLLNVIGLLLLVLRIFLLKTATASLLPLIAIFSVSMIYVGYTFFQTEALFQQTNPVHLRPLSSKEWLRMRRKKIFGYLFRLLAVIIWGIQPLYLKYSPAAHVDPLARVFFMSVGILLISVLLLFVQLMLRLVRRVPHVPLLIPRNKELLGIIIGAAVFTYFLNASLVFTTSTNFILFNNFSPTFALLIAVVFWRDSIPYLKDPRHMLWIFLLFLLGSMGSSLLIYSDIHHPSIGTVYGDLLGMVAMAADTLYVIAQIRYMKVVNRASSLSVNIHVSGALVFLTLPLVLLFGSGLGALYADLTPILYAIGAGVLSGIGQLLNYETFRRVDGFIAFLMFNISILITFVTEVFLLHTVYPSWVILIGGFIIIGSTVLAEVIHSHCQKKGL